MVAGVFVYPHLFSTQKTNVSDLLTSDSPTRFLNRLVSVLVAVATLPLWEGLFRHTDPTPSSEKIKWVAVAPPTVWSRCISSAVSVRCPTIPVPVKCLSRNDARQHIDGRRRRSNRQLKFKEQKLSGDEKVQPRNPFALSQPRLTPSFNNPNSTWTITIPEGKI